MFTARDLLGEGLTTELGGEFIDTGHADMLGLAAELGLQPTDSSHRVPLIAPPLRLDGERPPIHRPPPRLDEHGEEIRTWLRAAAG
jgi:hypothetical protein